MEYTKERKKSHFWASVGCSVAIAIIWTATSPMPTDFAAWIMSVIWVVSLIIVLFLDLKLADKVAPALVSAGYGLVSPFGAFVMIFGWTMDHYL